MKKQGLKKGVTSIRYRIMLIFLIIVFIVMTVAGVFITKNVENYQIDYMRTNCAKTADTLRVTIPFESYGDLAAEKDNIRAILDEWQTGKDYEIFIYDRNMQLIASDNGSDGSGVSGVDEEVIISALRGTVSESRSTLSSGIRVLNYAEPVELTGGTIIGVIYLRADLTGAYDMEDAIRIIFLQAMLIAIVVSVILSMLITGSITGPINDLRQKAEKMAGGDFSQSIEIRSDDEIGRLAEMFNILRQELDSKITEISNEKTKLETILKYMADGLVATDLNGDIIHINPAARRLLEINDEEMEGLNFDYIMQKMGKRDIADGINLPPSREVISEVLGYGDASLYIRYARIMDEGQRDMGVIMLIQDITERERLDRMQQDFVANVSHELRTPLTTIKSYAETLADGSVDDPDVQARFLDTINSEAERMTNLVKDLLQLSSLDNNAHFNMKKLNLIDLAEESYEQVMFTAGDKKQNLIRGFELDGRVMVRADHDRIKQVVLNMLTNAIKYTQNGGTIRLNVGVADNMASISVEDNGMGISRDELPRIFERFYRVDKARSRGMGGTGLGLSIAKQIVEGHGGTIRAESADGEGSRFTVLLPLDDGEEPAADRSTKEA